MGTEFIINRDSSPDFFGRSSQYEDGHIFVAVEEDKIVGTAGCAIREVQIGGEPVSACYEFGFLVDPAQRRNGIASKLHDQIETFAVERDVDLLNLDVLEDNLPAINLFQKKGFRHVRTLKNYIFSSIEKRPVSKPEVVHNMFDEDLEEVVDLLNDTYSGYDYYKDYSVNSLKAYIERIPYLKLNDIKIFKEDGEINACLGYWESHKILRWKILQLTPAQVEEMKKMNAPFNLQPGDVVRANRIPFIGFNDGEALADLIRYIINMACENSVVNAAIIADGESPLGEALSLNRPSPILDIPELIKPLTDINLEGLGERPFYFDTVDS